MKIVQKPSPNHYALSETAYLIFLHTTLGSYTGSIFHLRKKNNPSAHFVVGRQGQVAQLVSVNRGAWHAGVIKNPSAAAKLVCRKNVFGKIKNPNKYSIGIEHAAGWDIDRDGIVESWEKAFNKEMILSTAKLILHIEKETGIVFPDKHILTHKDVTSYKPDLQMQRSMVLSTLNSLRGQNPPDPNPPAKKIILSEGDNVSGKVVGEKIIIKKS